MAHPDGLAFTRVDTDDDAMLGRWLAINDVVHPRPRTLAGFRAELLAATDHLELLATLDGVDVGAGGSGWGVMSAEARTAFLDVGVLPSGRGRGIGSALADRCVAFARERGMEYGRSSALEGDEASIRFAARYGLEVVGGGQVGFLELTGTPVSAWDDGPSAGIEITSFADRPDTERAVYDLEVLVQPEVPTLALEPTPTFAAWHAQLHDDQGFLPALSLLALRDGEVVGAIQTFDNGEGTAFIAMTAVHPKTRRQGIARALKHELARRARDAGWRRLETFNDGTNEAMRALNLDLGYVYLPRMVTLKGPLPGVSGEPAPAG
jgi:GNAT superfamily N-acetyltransferase